MSATVVRISFRPTGRGNSFDEVCHKFCKALLAIFYSALYCVCTIKIYVYNYYNVTM